MSLASSSAVSLLYVPEVTFGVTPVSGNTRALRMTGETLDYQITKTESKEINPTRTISSVTPTAATASGGITGEISYQEWDILMAATLQSTFTVFGTAGVGAVFTTTAGGITTSSITASVATSGSSSWANLKKGQWFKLNAPGDANNDGKILRTSASVACTTTVLTVDVSTPLVANAGTVAGATIATSRLTHGTTQTSFSIERGLPDATTPQFFNYTGMTPSKMSIEESSGALSGISFDFMGKQAIRAATTSQLPASPTASYAYDIHSGVAGSTVVIWEGGAPLTGTFVKSVKFDFDNTLRAQSGIGTLGSVGIGSGTIKISGEMEIYLADGALYDKFVNNTASSIIFSSVDNSGNGYIFTLPKVIFSQLKTNASGKDQDMMLTMNFMGLRDSGNADATLQKAIFIDRVGAAAV